MELSPKNKLKTHRYVGILSLAFLFSRPVFLLLSFPDIAPPEIFSTYIGRIGAILGVLAFVSGGGLGKFLTDERAKVAEIHTIIMLAGLVFQVPVLADTKINTFANIGSLLGCILLFCGWILGRRIFNNRKRILPF